LCIGGDHHLPHALVLLFHHLHHHFEHLQVLCALLLVLLGKVTRELFEDLIGCLYELLWLQELHVSMRDLGYQFFKLFRIVAIDDHIFPWDFYLPILFVSGKLSCDEIITRFFNICMGDYQENVPGIKVPEKLADNFNSDSLLKVHAVILGLNDEERGINIVASNGHFDIGNDC
jgi:hypothetical protein